MTCRFGVFAVTWRELSVMVQSNYTLLVFTFICSIFLYPAGIFHGILSPQLSKDNSWNASVKNPISVSTLICEKNREALV